MQRMPLVALTASIVIVAASCPARADISVAGGGYTSTSPSVTGGAVMLSSGASIPAVPVEVQGTLLVPITEQGGYALTAEVRGFSGAGRGGAYIGAGLGFGNLSLDRSTAPVLTIFGGKSIAPFTSVEIRLYKQTNGTGATAGFLGLRFSV
jgi:hypothetical protein